MRRWERNGCAVHAELPFRFSVICSWYQSMLLIRKLNWYLMEVQKTAKERMETLVARLLREYPAPDKEANPFAWVGNMNMLIAMAEECVINDLVYR